MRYRDLTVGKSDHAVIGMWDAVSQSVSAPVILHNNPVQESMAHTMSIYYSLGTCEFWLTYACLGFKMWLGPGLLRLISTFFGLAASWKMFSCQKTRLQESPPMPRSDTLQAFACVLSTNIPLANASHVAKPQVKGWRSTHQSNGGEGGFAEESAQALCKYVISTIKISIFFGL